METAQKFCLLLLLWSLPISMLPHTVAKPRATASPTPNEAQLKFNIPVAGDWDGKPSLP